MSKFSVLGLVALCGLILPGSYCRAAPPDPTPSPSPAPTPAPTPAPKDGQTFVCSGETTPVSGKWGYLQIKRDKAVCGFRPADQSTAFFAIETANLRLEEKEFIKLVSSAADEPERKVSGPIDADYLLVGMKQPEIAFNLQHLDSTIMTIKFTQIDPTIPITGDRSRGMIIQSINLAKYDLAITKTPSHPLYLHISGSSEAFGHHLIEANTAQISVGNPQQKKDQRVIVELSLVSGDCSKSFSDKVEVAHDLAGPDLSKVELSYRCVNVFSYEGGESQAHYDVSFENFLDITDKDDELTISDGTQTLKVEKFSAKSYYQNKPEVSFRGKNLIVSYDSPRVASKKFMSKLIVKSKTTGGIVGYGKLDLPAKGAVARYTLRSDDSATSLLLANFKGGDLKLSDDQRRSISLTDGMFLPPEIGIRDSIEDTTLEVSAKPQPSGSIEFSKSATQCSGSLFEPVGTISLNGTKKDCYWLLGSRATLNDLKLSDGCLEIHPLNQKDPIFSRCKSDPLEVLPRFVVGPAFLKVTLGGFFGATVSPPPSSGLVSTSSSSQITINSAGYPAYYAWSDVTESYQINATGKSMVLSVRDLDLRDGEKFFLDTSTITSNKTDIDISNKTVTVKVQRSSATKDYKSRRGFSVISTQFDVIMADVKTSPIKTPEKLTNILVRVPAPPKTRISFNITSKVKDASIILFDSQSLMGRQISKDEITKSTDALSGSTTTNTLLVWIKSTETTVSFSQIACNLTSDHLCDLDTRCIPRDKLCKGISYCEDGSDLRVPCSSPPPRIIQRGISGATVFFLSVFMFALGVLATLYGPDFYKNINNRFRSGQYTTFSSTE